MIRMIANSRVSAIELHRGGFYCCFISLVRISIIIEYAIYF